METNKNEKNDNLGLGIGLCFGTLAGFIVGIIVSNILIGITSGAAIGVVLGNIYDEIMDHRNKWGLNFRASYTHIKTSHMVEFLSMMWFFKRFTDVIILKKALNPTQ